MLQSDFGRSFQPDEDPQYAIIHLRIKKDNCDGSCSVDYVPTEPGDYDISIKFAGKHIPSSPFKVLAEKQVLENSTQPNQSS